MTTQPRITGVMVDYGEEGEQVEDVLLDGVSVGFTTRWLRVKP